MAKASCTINGIKIEVEDGVIRINGRRCDSVAGSTDPLPPGGGYRLELNRDGLIRGNIHGDLTVTASGPVTLIVNGDIGGSVHCDGNVACEQIGGSATAGRDITTNSHIGGSANAGHDIRTGSVGGSANAGRDLHVTRS